MPAPFAVLVVVAAALGLVVGSFLNVCIHRLPRDLSVVRPRSACPGCGAGIAWYDNVPLVSFILLGGRCRRCRAPIAARYPLVEAATGALWAGAVFFLGPTLEGLVAALFGSALIALILIDAEHQILPDAITLPGIACGIALAPLRAHLEPGLPLGETPIRALAGAAGAAALGYAIPWALNGAYRLQQRVRGTPTDAIEDGIGEGDFKLLAMVGAFLGWRLLLFTLFAGAITGAAWGISLMVTRGYGWKSKLPFGVFLGAAALLAAFVGGPALGWYLGLVGVEP
ncbi:MAG TPA: prepilin peptidase [Candidatus Polarisedimenticolia bacterium]|nr:prepilin peptidase [Candidatus Polarisedimenticolia bacterium]